MKQKVVCLLITVALLMSALAGCGQQGNLASSTHPASANVTSVPTVLETETHRVTTQQSQDTVVTTVSSPNESRTGASSNATTPVQTTTQTTVTQAPSTPPSPQPTIHTLTPLSASSYYGLSKLKTMPNANALVATYEKLAQAVSVTQVDVALDSNLTKEEFVTVFFYYRADYPQHFWCDNQIGYSISQKTKKVVSAELHYTMTGDALRQAQTKFNAAVTELLKLAATGSNEYEREKLLHDALIKRISYVDGSHAHDAYGALVEGKAVCEGYARAFQYVLYQAGIQCLIAEGNGINPGSGELEPHAWNVVRIDGQYYHVDVTWDDVDDTAIPVVYAYFNVTTAQIEEDHTISSDESYALPTCVATAANYHVKNGTLLQHYAMEHIAMLLGTQSGGLHVYCINGYESFEDWFNKNHRNVTTMMGIRGGYSYRLLSVGKEVVVIIQQ